MAAGWYTRMIIILGWLPIKKIILERDQWQNKQPTPTIQSCLPKNLTVNITMTIT